MENFPPKASWERIIVSPMFFFLHTSLILSLSLSQHSCTGNTVVAVPSGAAPGVIMLHNAVAKGLHLSLNKKGVFETVSSFLKSMYYFIICTCTIRATVSMGVFLFSSLSFCVFTVQIEPT